MQAELLGSEDLTANASENTILLCGEHFGAWLAATE